MYYQQSKRIAPPITLVVFKNGTPILVGYSIAHITKNVAPALLKGCTMLKAKPGKKFVVAVTDTDYGILEKPIHHKVKYEPIFEKFLDRIEPLVIAEEESIDSYFERLKAEKEEDNT